ncbi:hypothetical protein SF12_21475 [Streptomyces sp. MBRL 601]|nr:hypothetical protein SF12_21475 [Streptomyces sp. MBRL 601]
MDADGEAEPRDPGLAEPAYVPPHRLRVLGVQLERRDEQQLAALHVRHRVGQLARVGPAHRGGQAFLTGAHRELERGVVDEGGEGGRHMSFR